MSVLGLLVPLAVLGLIAWAIVGVTRRGGDPFTLATATALYARVMLIVGVLMSLVGIGILIKAAIGFINLGYSYYQPVPMTDLCPAGGGCVSPLAIYPDQRSQDLVLGITLVVIGLLVAGVHLALGRAVSRMPGGSPGWITRGTLLGMTVMTAIVGIPSASIGLYQMLSYFIVGNSQQNQQTWGEPLGLAIAFVPAWIFLMWRLVDDLQRPHTGATSV